MTVLPYNYLTVKIGLHFVLREDFDVRNEENFDILP
jgi:hypothetical protein